jgi:hypothetical protein
MRALFRIVRRVGLVALAGLVLTTPAVGQTGLATVTGLVADSSGAAVPGVTVTATNQATNIAYTGITNDAGNYVITSVPIGEYIISAAGLTGFKGVQSKVTLSVAQTARVDFKMEVGNIEERVDVIATGAVLQTENAVVGIKADREQVEKLPAISRNVSFVTMYAPGVTQPLMSNFNSLSGGGRPYVNGQLQQANNFTIDGVDTNEAINNSIAYQPSPDAVEQVSVETNNYSAELGNVTGAVVNMVIKSGTNQFHGQSPRPHGPSRESFSAPSRICRPNRPKGERWTHDRISFRSAWCSTRWRPGSARSRVRRTCRFSPRSCETHPDPLPR